MQPKEKCESQVLAAIVEVFFLLCREQVLGFGTEGTTKGELSNPSMDVFTWLSSLLSYLNYVALDLMQSD